MFQASHLKHNQCFDRVLKAYKDASAAEDASNKKPAIKKPLGLVPIGKAF